MFKKFSKLALGFIVIIGSTIDVVNAANNADSNPSYNNPYMTGDIVFTAGTNVERTITIAKHPSAQSDCVCKWQNSPLQVFKGTTIPEKQSLDGTGFSGSSLDDTNPNPLYYSALVDLYFEGENCGEIGNPGGSNDYTGVITCNPNSTATLNDIGHAAVPFTPCVLTCNVSNGSTVSTTQDFSGASKYEACILSGGNWNEDMHDCACEAGKSPDATTGACKSNCSPSYSYSMSGTSCMQHDDNNCGGSDLSADCANCSGYSGDKDKCCAANYHWDDGSSSCVADCNPSLETDKGGFTEEDHCDGSCDYSTGLYDNGSACGCLPGYKGTGVGGSCAACGYGSYRANNTFLETSCNSCGGNEYTTGTTSSASTDCKACPANSSRNAMKNGCNCNAGYENPSGVESGAVLVGQSCTAVCTEGPWTNTTDYRINSSNDTCEMKQIKSLCPSGTSEQWVSTTEANCCASGTHIEGGVCVTDVTCSGDYIEDNGTCYAQCKNLKQNEICFTSNGVFTNVSKGFLLNPKVTNSTVPSISECFEAGAVSYTPSSNVSSGFNPDLGRRFAVECMPMVNFHDLNEYKKD